MARWEPGATQRLQKAAFELFAVRGFEQTTAAEIAAAAGLTQRTFFRHFADKRDVLFHGQDEFEGAFVDGMTNAEADATPMQLVAAALRSAAAWFPDERRPYSQLRQGVIDANPALQERERHKLAGLAVAVAAALRERGVDEPAATLAAESGVSVFGIAFTQWLQPDETRPLGDISADTLARLRALHT